jgi:hypothetical protein
MLRKLLDWAASSQGFHALGAVLAALLALYESLKQAGVL